VTEVTLSLEDCVEFMCWRFATAPDLPSLARRGEALKIDKERKEDYTLIEGGLDRLRAAYKKRFDELKGVVGAD
jgi:hypothetical protein